jgi:NAD(P)-dependent dehydrogenase (short-subunit alcohol dehydrogenase family)
MELRDRTVLVTGGAVRIGAAIVRALAAAGMRVAVHYRHSAAEAKTLCDEIRAAGGRAAAVAADLDHSEELDGLISAAARAVGPLDALVNNAAVFHKDTLDTLRADRLGSEFRINLFAPLFLMRDFAAQGRPGAIVNLLDRRIAGLDPSSASYTLAKKTLAEATRLAARHWAPRLRVNGVAPGPVLPPPGNGPETMREKAGPIPLGRPCTPEQIAEAVRFLLAADGITGQILTVDGGQHLVL